MTRALIIGAAASAVALIAGGQLVPVLRRLGLGKEIPAEGPESHMSKAGTPTMGGLLILGTIAALTIPTNLVGRESILLPLLVMGGIGALGAVDDLLTLQGRAVVTGHERIGLIVKTAALVVLGLGVGLVLYFSLDVREFHLPHFGSYPLEAGYIPVAIAVVAGTTSAAAVTDGLDGLLGGLMVFAFGAYGVIAGMQGQTFLATFCFTVAGALVGFLWYNVHPAQVFMGEAGALPLGAGLATVALMTGWWPLLVVIGIVLIAEILSDVIQIGSFQLTGRRVFKMAPLHHHFELAGWPETKVVLRFWLVGMVAALLGVALVLTE